MDELHYANEITPFTEEDWKKCMEVFGQHRFRSEMYGSWLAETEEARKLRELAETYHARCDAYDKRVCSGISPRTGEAIPLTPDEMRAVNTYARDQRYTAIVEGERLGFTREQVEKAIRDHVRGIG